VGTINFDNANSYTVASANNSFLILEASAGNARINVSGGHHTISAPVVLASDPPGSVLPAALAPQERIAAAYRGLFSQVASRSLQNRHTRYRRQNRYGQPRPSCCRKPTCPGGRASDVRLMLINI